MILTADKDAEFGIRSVLENRRSWLAIRQIAFQCVVHPKHDSGGRKGSAEFLRAFLRTHDKVLAIFDLEGSGAEGQPVSEIERRVEDALTANGWQHRCSAIVLVPELESWIWDQSLSARKAARLDQTSREIRSLLMSRGFLVEGDTKPARPKEAFEFLLRVAQTKRSSSLFAELAKDVDLGNCKDRAFAKLVTTLRAWFPRG